MCRAAAVLSVVAVSMAMSAITACTRETLRPLAECSVPADCPTAPGDASCLTRVACTPQGKCEYEHVATGGSCDDQNPCTYESACNDDHTCTGGNVAVGETCFLGADQGICIEANGTGLCSPNHCFIDGVVYADGDASPDNPCAKCNAPNRWLAWTFETPGTLCNDDADPAMDGVCAVADAGTDIVCRHDRCFIDEVLYEEGAPRPGSECESCDPSRGEQFLTSWYSAVGRACPFGCSLTPAPHCVEPSNWGTWSGTTQQATGLTLAWIEADEGGSQSLVVSSAAVVIDTGSSGAPSITVNGTPLALTASDYRIIPQSTFHDGVSGRVAPPGIAPVVIPDLVAIKLERIAVSGTATVTCVGARPLALASVDEITLGGTWSVRCGRALAGAGGNATAGADPYAMRGGGGGGAAGAGGGSGPLGARVEGGASYGRAELQPLVGGGEGGAGASTQALIKDGLGGNEGTDGCWARSGTCDATPQWSNFAEWEANVWPTFAAPAAQGGEGGGALQVVSLVGMTVSGQILAWGEGGEGRLDCAAQSAGASGTLVCDYNWYPFKWDCGGCSDGSYASRWWRSWHLQTGGGGGAGGALLLEAPEVVVSSSAQLNVEGGGGGAACFNNTYNAYVCYASPTELAGANPTVNETGYGSDPGDSFWGALGGGEGGTALDGVSSPYAVPNPTSRRCDLAETLPPEVSLSSTLSVAWGGAGGAAGRIRVNTPDGSITCGGGSCAGGAVPGLSLSCAAGAPAAVCRFPSDSSHYKN